MTDKTCSLCLASLPTTTFGKKASCKDGLLAVCRPCDAARARAWRAANPDTVREVNRRQYSKDKSASKKRSAKYRMDNPNKVAGYRRSFNDRNPDAQYVYDAARRAKAPLKYKARVALGRALRYGSVARPDVCTSCNVTCTPHGHHWSYLPEHWLDVVWLCAKCHTKEHNRIKQEAKSA